MPILPDAGIYIDQDGGGQVHVGWVRNRDQHMAAVSQVFPYLSRLRPFTAARTKTQQEDLYDRVSDDVPLLEAEGIDVKAVTLRTEENVVYVGVPSPSAAIDSHLKAKYGAGVAVTTGSAMQDEQNFDRFKRYTRINAGLQIFTADGGSSCTVAYSAYRRIRTLHIYYHLTAGHCGDEVFEVWEQGGRRIGETVANYDEPGSPIDAQLVSARRRRTSNAVFGPAFRRTVTGVESIRRQEEEGNIVCISGAVSGNECGELKATDHEQERSDGGHRKNQRVATYAHGDGDSGAPIYRKRPRRTALAVGIHSGNTGATTFLGLGNRAVYTHASRVQDTANVSICARGRARCGR